MKFEFYLILFKDWLKLGGRGGGQIHVLICKTVEFFLNFVNCSGNKGHI